MHVFSACRKIYSRLKAQKLFYVLRSLGYPVRERYKYKDYGPYSEELASEIETSVRLGYLDEEEVRKDSEDEEVSYTRYDLEMTSKGEEFLRKFPERRLGPGEAEALKGAARALNEYTPTQLELIATLMYVRDVGVKGDRAKYVMGLKPKFQAKDIEKALGTIRRLERDFSPKRAGAA